MAPRPPTETSPQIPGTANGDNSTACRELDRGDRDTDTSWRTTPSWVSRRHHPRNADSRQQDRHRLEQRYTSKDLDELLAGPTKAPGMFEASHWIAGSMQNSASP